MATVYGGGVDIAILHVHDCPSLSIARARVREALGELDLIATVREVEVVSAAEAVRLGMSGSPTLLFDGQDAFGGQSPSVACRLYRNGTRLEGAPSVSALVKVLADRPRASECR